MAQAELRNDPKALVDSTGANESSSCTSVHCSLVEGAQACWFTPVL